MSFQTGVTNLYNEFVNKGVTPSGQTLSAMKAAVTTLYNAGTTAGKGSHSTTYTMTSSEKTKDLGTSHSYRYINANNVYNAGSNSAHQTTTYSMGTKASAAASTYDLGASNKYRYINATAAWNKASSTGYASGTAAGHHSTTYTMTTAEKTKDLGAAHQYRYINANNVYNAGTKSGAAQAVVNLGTGTSFNVKSYSGYASFTANSFIVGAIDIAQWQSGDDHIEGNYHFGAGGKLTITKSYNASSGVLTAYATMEAFITMNGNPVDRVTKQAAVRAYLIRT